MADHNVYFDEYPDISAGGLETDHTIYPGMYEGLTFIGGVLFNDDFSHPDIYARGNTYVAAPPNFLGSYGVIFDPGAVFTCTLAYIDNPDALVLYTYKDAERTTVIDTIFIDAIGLNTISVTTPCKAFYITNRAGFDDPHGVSLDNLFWDERFLTQPQVRQLQRESHVFRERQHHFIPGRQRQNRP
jgi:hypothetical protein